MADGHRSEDLVLATVERAAAVRRSAPFDGELLSAVTFIGTIEHPDTFASAVETSPGQVRIAVAGDVDADLRRDLPAGGVYTFVRVAHSYGDLARLSRHIADDSTFFYRDELSMWWPDAPTNKVVVILRRYSACVAQAVLDRYDPSWVCVSPSHSLRASETLPG